MRSAVRSIGTCGRISGRISKSSAARSTAAREDNGTTSQSPGPATKSGTGLQEADKTGSMLAAFRQVRIREDGMKNQMEELQKLKGIGEVLSRRLVEASYDTIAKVAAAGEKGLERIAAL